jgi:hypothetical protein
MIRLIKHLAIIFTIAATATLGAASAPAALDRAQVL